MASKNKMIVLDLAVPPPTNSRFIRVKNHNKFVLHQDHKKYKTYVQGVCLSENVTPITGEVGMEVTHFRAQKRSDIDSRLKILLDALEGCAYENDSQVMDLRVRLNDDFPTKPRVLVTIYPL